MPRRSAGVGDTERLIELVFSSPMIYDHKHREYRHAEKKERVWQGIGQELGVASDVVKKRWKNLRDCYIKYLNNLTVISKPKKNSYDTWKWTDKMHPFQQFFQNAETERKKSANTSEAENAVTDNTEINYNDTEPKVELTYDYVDSNDHDYQENIEEEQNALLIVRKETLFNKVGPNTPGTSCTETNFEKPPIKRKKLEVPGTEKVIEYLQGNIEPELDDTDLLLLGFSKTIKKLSRKRQITAKRKISEIVFDLEMEELEEC